MHGPVPRVLGAIPFVGRPVRTARVVLGTGARMAGLAVEAIPVLREQTFWRDGRVEFGSLRALRTFAADRTPALKRELAAVQRTASWPLPGPLGSARSDLVDKLSSAVHGLEVSTLAADLSERVLGAQSERRYLIAFENPAEMRGVGGMWANYGVLIARDGRLELGRFGRVDEINQFGTYRGPDWYLDRYFRFIRKGRDWRQIPSGPDFPTVASIAEQNLTTADGIGPIHGTIAVDPVGLAALLRITGPVPVRAWHEPITADNVVPATLNEAYTRFETDNDKRVAFLGDTARAVWSKLLSSPITMRGVADSGLGDAIGSKHLRLHFARPEEQELARALEADGGLGGPDRTFALVTQNIAGNKMDFWLERELDVDLDLAPNGRAHGEATVTLRNRGPATGQARYVIGPFNDDYKQGWNRQLIRLYLPGSASVRPGSGAALASEQGLVVVEWYVDIPPGGSVERRLEFSVRKMWDPKTGRLGMRVRKQASLHPDHVGLSLRPPWGWRLSLPEGQSCAEGPAYTDIELEARMERWMPAWVLGPWARDVACGMERDV